MAKTLDEITIEEIIPRNLLEFKEIADICKVLKLPMADVVGSIFYDAIIANFDKMPEEVVDLLAWQWHVDYYDSTADVETKRTLVRESLEVHRHKGTKYAVNMVLSAISEGYHIEEWFEYGGEPYHFNIIEANGDLIDYSETEIIKAVKESKNTRSWIDGIRVEVLQKIKQTHYADIHLSLETQQGYWVDSTFINLYWNGYHYTGGEGHTYNRTFKANNTVKYDGVLYKHTHYFNGELENSGKEWLEIGGNKQRHSADISHLVEPMQVYGQVKGYKLNSHFKMNNAIKYEWPKIVNYLQSALCITTKGGISTQEAV